MPCPDMPSSCSSAIAMVSIVERGDVIRRASFPRIAIPLGASLASTLALVLNLVVLLTFLLVSGISIRPPVALLPLLIVELYLLSLGCSLVLAALFVRFRDLRHIWDLLLQVLFYLTPILYPLSFVPGSVAGAAAANPLAQIITDARKLVIEPSTVTAFEVLPAPLVVIPYILPLLVVLTGFWYFDSTAARLAEEL
jgi:ABC-2 type transport system permease protein